MLKATSKEFRALFLLKFTRELIKNSNKEFIELEKIVEDEEKEFYSEKKPFLPQRIQKFPLHITKIPLQIPRHEPLRIPIKRFPQRLQHIRPTPTSREIDLGKLNPLIKDIKIKFIECNGTNVPVRVRGAMGVKESKISLTKEEIDEIIKKFSQATKIPVQVGVFRVAFGKLILSAIVSKNIGSKFIIEKILAPVQNPQEILRVPRRR